MPVRHLSVKSNCVTWSNIQLPHPNKYLKSSVFCFGGFKWYFEIFCSWREKNCSSKTFEEVWQFSIKNSNHSNPLTSYIIMPYVKVGNKYVRLASTINNTSIWRSSLSSIIGTDVDEIKMLFFFSPESLTVDEPVFLFMHNNNKTTQTSVENLKSLESLSDDITKLLNDSGHVDATLKCGNKTFSVHRNILAARSSVFSAMFKHDMSEKNTGVVDIVDLDPDILEQFLLYLYSGNIEEMCMDTAFELYKTAEKYAVHSLKQFCVPFILNEMDRNSVCKILLLADQSGDAKFLDSVISFAAKSLDSFKLTEWKDFSLKFPAVAIKVYAKHYEDENNI